MTTTRVYTHKPETTRTTLGFTYFPLTGDSLLGEKGQPVSTISKQDLKGLTEKMVKYPSKVNEEFRLDRSYPLASSYRDTDILKITLPTPMTQGRLLLLVYDSSDLLINLHGYLITDNFSHEVLLRSRIIDKQPHLKYMEITLPESPSSTYAGVAFKLGQTVTLKIRGAVGNRTLAYLGLMVSDLPTTTRKLPSYKDAIYFMSFDEHDGKKKILEKLHMNLLIDYPSSFGKNPDQIHNFQITKILEPVDHGDPYLRYQVTYKDNPPRYLESEGLITPFFLARLQDLLKPNLNRFPIYPLLYNGAITERVDYRGPKEGHTEVYRPTPTFLSVDPDRKMVKETMEVPSTLDFLNSVQNLPWYFIADYRTRYSLPAPSKT